MAVGLDGQVLLACYGSFDELAVSHLDAWPSYVDVQGQPVLVASWESTPTLLQHDFFFPIGAHQKAQVRVNKSQLVEGTYYFGVYNLNYNVKGTAV